MWTYEDLTFQDESLPEANWLGRWEKKTFASDKIKLNTAKIDDRPEVTTNVIMHELGHALGINDHRSYSSCYTESDLVMWYKANEYTSLQPHDIEAYNDIWDN